jgi:CRISPR system Cascade subunit CasE
MYLTRFQINPARRGARKLLASPQAVHAAVLAGFTETTASVSSARILWRIDAAPDGQVLLYIASPSRPDLTHLVEQAGWPTTGTWQTRPYEPLLASLQPAQQWAFRLTANPVRNSSQPDGRRSRRFGHVTVDQQREWLLARATQAGFQVALGERGEPDVIVHRRQTFTFGRNGRTVTLRMATYDGRLEVVDATALRHVLVAGLGHAKAYGCGLLTLAPAG